MNGQEDMADHTSLDMDRLMAGSAVDSSQEGRDSAVPSNVAPIEHAISIDTSVAKGACLSSQDGFAYVAVPMTDGSVGPNGIRVDSEATTAEVGIQAECRICQEEDDVNNLETPCACSGSVKVPFSTKSSLPVRVSLPTFSCHFMLCCAVLYIFSH